VDLSNLENNGEIIMIKENDDTNDLWIPLEDGDPMELEGIFAKKKLF
jgi:hypothetical protein